MISSCLAGKARLFCPADEAVLSSRLPLPEVLVGVEKTAHDLDGVGIAGFDDGSHLIQLKLGFGYDTRCVAMTDRNVGVWEYMATPNIMLSRDDHEVWQVNVIFSLPAVELKVPDDAPRLEIIEPVPEKDIKLEKIQVAAEADPFVWGAAVIFADGRKLTCGPAGWFLDNQRVRFRIDLEIDTRD